MSATTTNSPPAKGEYPEGGRGFLPPKLRFPDFRAVDAWKEYAGSHLFDQVNDRNPVPGLPVLAITQEHGAIPRHMIDYHVSVSEKSIESYKVVQPGDFIISLRPFQGGIEFSQYEGICSPAYVVLRRKADGIDEYFRYYLKTDRFIQILTKNLEGLRDGKMISYKQFSELTLPVPSPAEQQKIADCLSSLDELISAQARKVETLKTHKKGQMQRILPREGKNQPSLRFSEFQSGSEWMVTTIGQLVDKNWLYPPRDGNHGGIHPKSSDYVAYGIPFIMASDLKDGQIDTKGCHFISMEQADSLQKGFAREGDVLLTHKGTVGAVAIVPEIETPYLMLTPQVTYYRVKNKVHLSNNFLAQIFLSPVFQENLLASSGGGTRSYIGIIEQAKLPLCLPIDLNEQHQIADCLTSLDELITAATQELDTLKTHKKGLMQQLFPAQQEMAA